MLYLVIPVFLLCALLQSTDTDNTETEDTDTPCEIPQEIIEEMFNNENR